MSLSQIGKYGNVHFKLNWNILVLRLKMTSSTRFTPGVHIGIGSMCLWMMKKTLLLLWIRVKLETIMIRQITCLNDKKLRRVD